MRAAPEGTATWSMNTAPVNHSLGPDAVLMLFFVICMPSFYQSSRCAPRPAAEWLSETRAVGAYRKVNMAVLPASLSLLDAAKQGDDGAFEILLRPLLEPGYRLAGGMLQDPQAAQDAVHGRGVQSLAQASPAARRIRDAAVVSRHRGQRMQVRASLSVVIGREPGHARQIGVRARG